MDQHGHSTSPLRVAVIVGPHAVPQWVAWTVGRVERMEGCELAAVIRAPVGRNAGSREIPRVYGLYERLDTRVFGAAAALNDAELTAIAGRWAQPPPEDPVHLVVSFVAGDASPWRGSPPVHGVWTIVPAEYRQPGAGVQRFWDVAAADQHDRHRRDVGGYAEGDRQGVGGRRSALGGAYSQCGSVGGGAARSAHPGEGLSGRTPARMRRPSRGREPRAADPDRHRPRRHALPPEGWPRRAEGLGRRGVVRRHPSESRGPRGRPARLQVLPQPARPLPCRPLPDRSERASLPLRRGLLGRQLPRDDLGAGADAGRAAGRHHGPPSSGITTFRIRSCSSRTESPT